MAGNIPGTNGSALPGVFTNVETQSSGVSVPGGIRVTAIIGEGSTSQTIVNGALGNGNDGFNPTYTSTNGSDGRHFVLASPPVVSNRTSLFRNGNPLVGLEVSLIDSSSFSNKYDYRINITTGQIELQAAYIKNQGGTDFTSGASNVGVGNINTLSLVDVNAPSETWTIKCISVQRNAMNQPIANTANFIAFGSISGNKLDANGNPIIWISNNTSTSNGILKFKIQETGTAFREGDYFTVIVVSGVLSKNDTLTASYISTANLNSPTFLQSMTNISGAFGNSSTDNNLTLGCQLAFANSAPGIMCVQAAPSMPRRTSYTLQTSVNALSLNPDDFIFPLPLGVTPDLTSNIHFFVKNNTTNVEKQVLPNKFPYYTLGESGEPTVDQFIFDDTIAPSGNSFSYSVIQSYESLVSGLDGYITENPALGSLYGIFQSSVVFDSSYVGMTLKIIDSTAVANIADWIVYGVSAGKLYVQLADPFVSPPPIAATVFPDFVSSGVGNEGSTETFELIDPTTGLLVPGSDATDGVLVASVGTGAASLTSSAVTFNTFPQILNYKLKISGSNNNNGLYDVTANPSANSITIQKRVVTDTAMRYEVLDTSVTANNFIVVNHNVVPNNNALRVTIVDSRDANFYDAGWLNALAALEKVEIDILVPLPKQTISAIFQNCRSHCTTMSSIKNRRERVLFIGAISGLTPDNLTGATQAAVENIGVLEGIQGETVADVLVGNTEDLTNYSVSDAFGFGNQAFRTTYFYPDQIVVQAGADNILIDGFYIAAAAGGYFSGQNNIAMPLTNKVLAGLTILGSRQLSPFTIEQLANAGITVLQPVQGGGNVIWGITTTQSGSPEEQEISVVFIRDRIAKSLRSGFQAYIGLPEDDSTNAKLTARATQLANSFVSQQIITQFKDLLVVRDSVDPRQWNISLKVQPVQAVNWIYIKVGVGTL